MKFLETALPGAFLIEADQHRDERGGFGRSFCEKEFQVAGLTSHFPQHSISTNIARGIIRGMHFQDFSQQEVKIVRCMRGSILDVIVDVRPDSPTRGQHLAVELTAANLRSIYIPAGFAHGFQTLEEGSDLYYMMSAFYAPGLDRGYRWNDPAFGIQWPISNPTISARDRAHPDFPSVGKARQ